MDYAEVAKEAAILIVILAPAAAAVVEVLKQLIPPLAEADGNWPATIAGLLCTAATMCVLVPTLPESMTTGGWIMVAAIVFPLGMYSPKVAHDAARFARKAADDRQ